MAVDFSALKKQSFSLINEEEKNYKDDRYWKPTFVNMNASAIIRFLPPPKMEENPVLPIYSHAFEGKNGWYIENCPSNIPHRKCPVCAYNSTLWKQGASGQAQVRKQKRILKFISNIYVVKDERNPEAEGKVFLFKFGKKIYEKIKGAMYPEIEEDRIDVFNFWEGADFILKCENADGYPNYDKSYFRKPSVIGNLKDDSEIEKIWLSEHSLQDELKYKSDDELTERFNYVMGFTENNTSSTEEGEDEEWTEYTDDFATSLSPF